MAELNRQELQAKIIAITEKYEKIVKEKDKIITERDTELSALRKELDGLKRKAVFNNSSDDKIKKVLSFSAQLMSNVDIYEKMKYIGEPSYLEEIEEIINNIDCLSVELQEFYKKEKDLFMESIKVDNDSLKQLLHARYTRLLSSIEKDLLATQDLDDIQLKINLRKEYKDVLNSISSFSKNLDDKAVADETNSIIGDMEKEFEEMKNEKTTEIDEEITENMVLIN